MGKTTKDRNHSTGNFEPEEDHKKNKTKRNHQKEKRIDRALKTLDAYELERLNDLED